MFIPPIISYLDLSVYLDLIRVNNLASSFFLFLILNIQKYVIYINKLFEY